MKEQAKDKPTERLSFSNLAIDEALKCALQAKPPGNEKPQPKSKEKPSL
jgi:hypothetical protein